MEDEDRQWEGAKWIIHDFVELARSDAEELAAGLGLHPTVASARLALPCRYYAVVLPKDQSSSGDNFHVKATALGSGR